MPNPVLLAVLIASVVLAVTGIDYRTYFEGAQFVHFLLGPTTVALAADHAVCVIDAAGAVLWRHTISHSRAGLTRLTTRLREFGVTRVGIERPDGPVVEALLAVELRVAVVPPRQVKNLRSRLTRSGKDDRFDAYVLADAMRTDGHRFTDLTRDTAATVGLRALVRARQDLVEVRVGLVNQLRHTLELAFPGAVRLFSDLHSPIARAFLRRFSTAAEAAVLDEDSIAAWLDAEGYCGRTPAAVFIDRLRTAPAGLTGVEASARPHVTFARLAAIDAIEDQTAELSRRIKEALGLHPDAPIFTSLPRAGQIRAAALLGRDRRCPRPLSRSASPGRRGRGLPVHRRIGQTPRSRLPLPGRHQAAPGADRLRRRLPPPPIPGSSTPTAEHAPAACATHTPFASSPAPGPA